MGGVLNVQGQNYNENIGPPYNGLGLDGQVDDFVQVTSEKKLCGWDHRHLST